LTDFQNEGGKRQTYPRTPLKKGKTTKPLSKQIFFLTGDREVDKFVPTGMVAA
jgi:hypothetical protein